MSKFDCRRLSRHDIIEVLADSAVTEADLLRPNPDFICKLYTHILVHMNILKDDQEQMQFGVLEHLENSEHHLHAINIMDLYFKLQRLLLAIKCPKIFTPKDLIRPEPERTEIFLGALLNFHLHRNAKMDLLKPVCDDLEHFEQQKLAAEAKILQLNDIIETLREMEEPLVQEARLKKAELHQTVDELNKHQATLRTKIKQLKEKGKETDEKISDAVFALVQCSQENAGLRSKIIQSPHKLQRALEEKKLALTQAKQAERAAKQSFQDKITKLEAYAKACKEISKHFEVESKRRALELRNSQLECLVAEADAINLKMKNVREEAEAKIRDLGRKYEEIVSEFNKYSNPISNLLASSGLDPEAGHGRS